MNSFLVAAWHRRHHRWAGWESRKSNRTKKRQARKNWNPHGWILMDSRRLVSEESWCRRERRERGQRIFRAAAQHRAPKKTSWTCSRARVTDAKRFELSTLWTRNQQERAKRRKRGKNQQLRRRPNATLASSTPRGLSYHLIRYCTTNHHSQYIHF